MYPGSFLRRASLVVLILSAGPFASAQDRRATKRSAATGPLPTTTSPFTPPEENDYTFVIDSGAGLDTGCAYRGEGPLQIKLPIGRVLGDLAKLKTNGLVPAKVRLEFPAYDVDSAGAPGYPPERDRVSVNGNVVPGEFTTGLDGVWVMQRFDIPIEWLHLPADPRAGALSPLDNEIRIDIDTASGTDENWCTEVDWVTITIDNPIPPRPWIGAHGINPFPPFRQSDIWNDLWAPKIRELGIPADQGPDLGLLDSIQNNAGKIANAVSAARARWGVDRVNIVAHSKGGLDSRRFIEDSDDVENLVQLGTPNAGSPLADYYQGILVVGSVLGGTGAPIIANTLAAPASYQLTRPYMSVYNFFHGHNPNVKYMAIAGVHTPGDLFSDPVDNFLDFIVGEGDLIVPRSSVHALSYTAKGSVFSKFPQEEGSAKHTELYRNTDAFMMALPRVTGPGRSSQAPFAGGAGSFGPLKLSAANAAAASLALQHTQTFAGRLEQPQTASHTISVDAAGEMAFMLLHPEGDLDLKLTDPSGHVFDATTVVGNPEVSRQERAIPGGLSEVYAFKGSFAKGNWKATVTARSTNKPVAYNVVAWLEDAPLQMTAAADKLSAPVGGSFVLSATLVNGTAPVTGATVSADALLPDGVTLKSVALVDDGASPDAAANDGVYTARFEGATQPGAYGISLRASGSVAGAPFSRETYLSVFATASSSSLAGVSRDFGRDLNGNGFFDQLVVETPVQIKAAGTYRFAATLMDSSGNVLETSKSFALTPSSTSVELNFDGRALFARGVNGPYQITSVRMAEDAGQATLPLAETASTYNTGPYTFTQFEGGGLALTDTRSATGVDTNGNGKFDLLRADIGVNVRTAGSYQWSARLRDRNGREITLASNSGNLPSGAGSISLSFDGSAIGRNGVNGPFNVTDLALFNSAATLSVPNVLTTTPFAASDFEGFVAPAATVQFGSASYTVSENKHSVRITVTRSGDTTGAASVNYQTADGTASERSDYTSALGAVNFAPGETAKTFDLLITDDAYVESDETLTISLSQPTGGAAVGSPDTASVTVVSDDASASAHNPVDDSPFFVRQHYHDFLNREPDPSGLQFWIDNIESCGADAHCREVKRVDTSAAFFLSIEFQNTGYFVYRVHKAAFGDLVSAPVPVRLNDFLQDTQSIGRGIVVGQGNWQQQLEDSKNAFSLAFVQRLDFISRYPDNASAATFVNLLDTNTGGVLTQGEKDQLVAELSPHPADAALRADVLRKVVENQLFAQAQSNRAFVLMEYYGYLRRNPDMTPDIDYSGYQFWLNKLDQFGGDFHRAEMVKAFISSAEYRGRFNSQ